MADVSAKNQHTHKSDKLSKKRRLVVQIIYIIAVALWILLLFYLQVYKHNSHLGYLILLIPIFVFAMGYLSVGKITKDVRGYMLKADIVSVTVLFITAVLAGAGKETHFTYHIMVVAAVLVLLSLIDIWVGIKTVEIIQAVKSIFQTMAVTLIIYVIVICLSSQIADGGAYKYYASSLKPSVKS